MKKVISFLITLVVLVTTQSVAQQNPEKLDYVNKVEKYRNMKNTGATLTVIGGVLAVIGAATMYSSSYNMWTGEGAGTLQTGAITTVAGIAGLGSGIPLLCIGTHFQKKYSAKLEGLSVRVNANARSTGLTLSYRFK